MFRRKKVGIDLTKFVEREKMVSFVFFVRAWFIGQFTMYESIACNLNARVEIK
jgi:hypothetical protein